MGRRPSGLTITEILVVVAVLGVLIGLLVPALSGAREGARAAKCASGLRQWGIAVSCHLQEHQGLLPEEGATSATAVLVDTYWFNALPPYVDAAPYRDVYAGGSARIGTHTASGTITGAADAGYSNSWIWYCPTLLAKQKNATAYNSFHYSFNAVMDGTDTYGWKGPAGGKDFGRVRTLARGIADWSVTPVLFEAKQASPALGPESLDKRHGGGTLNMLYLDLHVDRHKADQVAVPTWQRGLWVTDVPRMTWGPFPWEVVE